MWPIERARRCTTEVGLASARKDPQRHLRRVSRPPRAVHHWCLRVRLRVVQSGPER